MTSSAPAPSPSPVPRDPRHPTLVVGYDGSAFSRAALRYAGCRAAEGGEVIVVHAREAPPGDLAPAARSVLSADHERVARALLDALALDVPAELEQAQWRSTVAEGPPARALIAAAQESGADEIVVGSHGAGRVGALLGSVAHDLLRRADRPVVVIGPHAVETAGTSS